MRPHLLCRHGCATGVRWQNKFGNKQFFGGFFFNLALLMEQKKINFAKKTHFLRNGTLKVEMAKNLDILIAKKYRVPKFTNIKHCISLICLS
jgi:hypothetical protein